MITVGLAVLAFVIFFGVFHLAFRLGQSLGRIEGETKAWRDNAKHAQRWADEQRDVSKPS